MKTFETELGLEYNSPMHIYRYGESLCLNSDLGMKHYRDDDAVKADADNIKAAWAILCKKAPGVGAVITDKQFSMINPKNIKSAIMLSTTKQRELFISIL